MFGESGEQGLDVAEKHGKEILNEIPEIIKNGNIDNRHKRLVRVYVLF